MSDLDVFAPPLKRRHWPIGVNYLQQFSDTTASGHAWVEFKLWAADWYLDTIRLLLEATEDLDRFVGVEMAFDGYLAACSSSFDAATGAIIMAIEEARAVPTSNQVLVWKRNWGRAKQLTDKQPLIQLMCRPDVDAALAGENDDQPSGWLAQLRRLRNRSTHEDTLSRHFRRGGGDESTQIRVPGRGNVDPFPYLEDMRRRCRDLIAQMMADVTQIRQ